MIRYKFTVIFTILIFSMIGFAQIDKTSTKELNVTASNPMSPVISGYGTPSIPGTRKLYYWIIAHDGNGNNSEPFKITVTNSPNTLSERFYNRIWWIPVSNAKYYDVLKTTNPSIPSGDCNCAVAVSRTLTNVIDKTESLLAYTVISNNKNFTFTNELVNGNSKLKLKYGSDEIFSFDKLGRYTNLMDGLTVLPSTTPDVFGIEQSSTHSRNIARWKITQDTSNESWPNYQGLSLYYETLKGGNNTWNGVSGSKTTYSVFNSVLVGHTKGQHIANGLQSTCYQDGDCIGADIVAEGYGGNRANGDEGLEPLSIRGDGGKFIFSATVSSTESGVDERTAEPILIVNYTSPQNEGTRGEGRYLINTSRNVYSTGSAAVSNEYTTPVVITGTGTLWSSLGSASGKCFAFDSTVINGIQARLVPIRAINSDTQITLDHTAQGSDKQWSIDASNRVPSSGTYKIYRCAEAVKVDEAGKIGVKDSTFTALAGDSIRLETSFAQNIRGIYVKLNPSNFPWSSGGVSVNNLNSSIRLGNAYGANGMWSNGIYLLGDFSKTGIQLRSTTVPPSDAWLFAYSNSTDVCEPMIAGYKNSGGVIKIENCHYSTADSDTWRFSGKHALGHDGRASIGAQSLLGSTQLYVLGSGNNTVLNLKANGTGNAITGQDSSGIKWDVKSDGTSWFTKVCYDSSHTICDYAGSVAPSGACTSGSTYRNSTTGKFSVCESSAWVQK